MVTEFGKFLRILRITKSLSAKDMAEKFKVTVSYLSAVETGKRSIPPTWERTLCYDFNLSNDEKKKLYEAIEKSSESLNLDLKTYNDEQKKLLWAVARGELDESVVQKLCEVIKDGEEK